MSANLEPDRVACNPRCRSFRPLRSAIILVFPALAASCSPTEFRFLHCEPDLSRPVRLNQSLVLHFNSEVLARSVDEHAIRVLDASGQPVRGGFQASGDSVKFTPALACRADLKDGGFSPAADYRLELKGSPFLRSLQSRRQERLRSSSVLLFRTVSTDPFFIDDRTEEAGGVVEVGHDDHGVLLKVNKPVDPRSLEMVKVRWRGPWGVEDHSMDPSGPLIVLFNGPEAARLRASFPSAPPAPFVEGQRYGICVDQGDELALTDLGGRPVRRGVLMDLYPFVLGCGVPDRDAKAVAPASEKSAASSAEGEQIR